MITLRELQDADEHVLFAWRREPEVDRWMSDAAFPSETAHKAWFEGLRIDPDMRGWMIVQGEAPAGLLTLTGLQSHHRRAAWNWFLGSAEARGRGVGRAAQVLGIDKAFGELGLEKVFAEVMADNDAALKAQTAVGFLREGYLRAHVLKGGVRRDVVLLGLLAEEWKVTGDRVRQSLIDARMIAG